LRFSPSWWGCFVFFRGGQRRLLHGGTPSFFPQGELTRDPHPLFTSLANSHRPITLTAGVPSVFFHCSISIALFLRTSSGLGIRYAWLSLPRLFFTSCSFLHHGTIVSLLSPAPLMVSFVFDGSEWSRLLTSLVSSRVSSSWPPVWPFTLIPLVAPQLPGLWRDPPARFDVPPCFAPPWDSSLCDYMTFHGQDFFRPA